MLIGSSSIRKGLPHDHKLPQKVQAVYFWTHLWWCAYLQPTWLVAGVSAACLPVPAEAKHSLHSALPLPASQQPTLKVMQMCYKSVPECVECKDHACAPACDSVHTNIIAHGDSFPTGVNIVVWVVQGTSWGPTDIFLFL